MRFTKKTAHRIIIALAMVFPFAYLIGTQIATLAGSHGEVNLSADYSVVTEERFVDFNQKIYASPNSVSNGITWNVNSNTGVVTISGTASSQYFNGISRVPVALVSEHVYLIRCLPASSGNYYCYFSSPYVTFANEWTRYTAHVNNSNIYFALTISNGYSFSSPVSFIPQFFDLTQMYGFGNEPTTSQFLADWGEGYYPYVTSEQKSLVVEGVPSYSQYLFNQLFPKDNFVSQIGFNAVGNDPKGFTPFAAMLRYIDLNMLHAGDTQIGLMFYGMIYWMLHVVLADLIYHVLVFIPNLIVAVCQWFGHGLDDDKGE